MSETKQGEDTHSNSSLKSSETKNNNNNNNNNKKMDFTQKFSAFAQSVQPFQPPSSPNKSMTNNNNNNNDNNNNNNNSKNNIETQNNNNSNSNSNSNSNQITSSPTSPPETNATTSPPSPSQQQTYSSYPPQQFRVIPHSPPFPPPQQQYPHYHHHHHQPPPPPPPSQQQQQQQKPQHPSQLYYYYYNNSNNNSNTNNNNSPSSSSSSSSSTSAHPSPLRPPPQPSYIPANTSHHYSQSPPPSSHSSSLNYNNNHSNNNNNNSNNNNNNTPPPPPPPSMAPLPHGRGMMHQGRGIKYFMPSNPTPLTTNNNTNSHSNANANNTGANTRRSGNANHPSSSVSAASMNNGMMSMPRFQRWNGSRPPPSSSSSSVSSSSPRMPHQSAYTSPSPPQHQQHQQSKLNSSSLSPKLRQHPIYDLNTSNNTNNNNNNKSNNSSNSNARNNRENYSNRNNNNNNSNNSNNSNNNINSYSTYQSKNFSSSQQSITSNQKIETPFRTAASYFMNGTLRKRLQTQSQLVNRNLDPSDSRFPNTPSHVGQYHTLYPLDDPQKSETQNISQVLKVKTEVYKAINSANAKPCALRRIENVVVQMEYASATIEARKQIQHPNIVVIRDVFHTDEFNVVSKTKDTVFIYEYCPGAETLAEVFMPTNPSHRPSSLSDNAPIIISNNNTVLTERMLWSIICQILAALRAMHTQGNMACRSIHPSKVLLIGQRTVKVNSIGMVDILSPHPSKSVAELQQQDFADLAALIAALACRDMNAVMKPNYLEMIGNKYSGELKDFVGFLLSAAMSSPPLNITNVIKSIGHRFVDELEYAQSCNEFFEEELAKELDNGRLFRLITKLGFINERPEYDLAPNWSETGDRYLIKLFRDYVFHETTEDGAPVIDMAHVVESLNKLDCGSNERILLMSRDEQSLLVVSYKDIKQCIESAFRELLLQGKRPGK